VVLELPSGKSCSVPVELLKATEGGYRIALRFRDLEQGVESDAEEPLVIPILEERAEIHKRKSAAGKVRIQKVVREHKQTIDEPLMHEEVEIRRIPVNRMVEEPPTTRLRGGTLVVPVLEEVLVVEKRLMLKEEIEIVKKRITRQEPQEVRLRSEEVVVTRLEHGEEP
jgi:uncharacterized protein (TIGR02271 family)